MRLSAESRLLQHSYCGYISTVTPIAKAVDIQPCKCELHSGTDAFCRKSPAAVAAVYHCMEPHLPIICIAIDQCDISDNFRLFQEFERQTKIVFVLEKACTSVTHQPILHLLYIQRIPLKIAKRIFVSHNLQKIL